MIGYLILIALGGLIVGALARLLLPGRDPMTIFQTMLVGIAGSLVAGVVAYYALGQRAAGFFLSLLCTIGLVYAIRKIRERNAYPAQRSAAASATAPHDEYPSRGGRRARTDRHRHERRGTGFPRWS